MFSNKQTRELIELTKANTEILRAIADNQRYQTEILKAIAGPIPSPNVIPFPSVKEIR